MKLSRFAVGLVFAGTALVLTGCVERRVYVPVYQQPAVVQAPPPGTVVVTQPPPAPQVEVVPVAPGPSYVWTPGYWSWNGRWVWVGGAYVHRPHPGAVWIGGHWAHHPRGYVWIGGHWR